MISEKVFLHNLGKEICEARKRLNMSQAELAEKADLSVTYISKIECGRRNFSAYTLARISQVLGLSSAQLLEAACEEKRILARKKIEELLMGYSPDEVEDILHIIRTVNELIAKKDCLNKAAGYIFFRCIPLFFCLLDTSFNALATSFISIILILL